MKILFASLLVFFGLCACSTKPDPKYNWIRDLKKTANFGARPEKFREAIYTNLNGDGIKVGGRDRYTIYKYTKPKRVLQVTNYDKQEAVPGYRVCAYVAEWQEYRIPTLKARVLQSGETTTQYFHGKAHWRRYILRDENIVQAKWSENYVTGFSDTDWEKDDCDSWVESQISEVPDNGVR